MSSRTIAGQALVDCGICGESIPQGHTLLRPEIGRICWFCYTDDNVDEDRDWFDDEEDEEPDWDDDAWYGD